MTPTRRIAAFADASLQDARAAARSVVRTPAVTVAVVATLALGIGSTTLMMSVVRSVVLRPLPFPQSAELVRIGPMPATAQQIEGLRSVDSLVGVTALSGDRLILEKNGRAEQVLGTLVDGHHHEIFGAPPALGRGLRAADSLPGAEPVVVLGHSLWQEQFGGDRDILGRSVRLIGDGAEQRTVVGVQGDEYRPGPWQAGFLIPHRYETGSHDWEDMARFWAVARIRPGASVESVQAEVRSVAGNMAAQGLGFSVPQARELTVSSLLESRVGAIGPRLLALLGTVVLVLLIGCANVANLMLVRALARRGEFAVRRSLGADRTRLVRQLLAEGFLFAFLGGGGGVVLAWSVLPWLRDRLPGSLPRVSEIRMDVQVLVASAALAGLVAMLFTLAPTLRLLREGGAGRRVLGETDGTRRRQFLLLAGQFALTVVLLSCCGLLFKSFLQLQSVDPGLRVASVSSWRVDPPALRYPEGEERSAYVDQVVEAVAALPGVEEVGAISTLPLSGGRLGVGISRDSQPVPEAERAMMVSYRAITPGYLPTVDVPLIAGRNIEPTDRAGSVPVGLVNERFVSQMFDSPGSALGRMLYWPDGSEWFTVVGVVGDVHQSDLATPVEPEVYVPYRQETWAGGMHVLARGSEVARRAVGPAVEAVDPLVPVRDGGSLEQALAAATAGARFNVLFFAGFAGLGVALAAVGLAGLTQFVISRRRSEFGLRLALGSDGARLVRHIVFGVFKPVAAGLVLGAVAALFAGRVVGALLFETSPQDPMVLLSVIAGLGALALALGGAAARKALGIQPSEALRAD